MNITARAARPTDWTLRAADCIRLKSESEIRRPIVTELPRLFLTAVV